MGIAYASFVYTFIKKKNLYYCNHLACRPETRHLPVSVDLWRQKLSITDR
jgi:hypothetical protein